MRLARLLFKSFLVAVITSPFFLAPVECVRGQDKPEPPKIIRKADGVLQGSATKRVEPVYPPLAKAAQVSGPVMVEVTIDEEGNVIAARPISGHPLLTDAAVAAARGWRFTPTQLGGVPVKVIGTITFNFNLDVSPPQTDPPTLGVRGGAQGAAPGGLHGGQRSNQSRMIASTGGLLAALERSGYRYSKVGEGVWDVAATGKNIGEFSIRVTMAEELILMLVKLADRKDVTAKNPLLLKLLEMNHRFDAARVALSDDMLYARIDVRARVADREEFNYAVEQLARVTDEIYPELKTFISSGQAPPGFGTGAASPVKSPAVGEPATGKGDANSEQLKLVTVNPAVDSRPVALNNPAPLYTEQARKNKVNGEVRLRILVGDDGLVKQAKVIGDGLPDGLNEQAMNSAYKMRFRPAMKDGKPVAFWMPIMMTFNLR
ncbi:MAG TPA: TonB family protein [Blastocatellia bacterium]|nr:TonB family protein [Blastocatellia bacterium]